MADRKIGVYVLFKADTAHAKAGAAEVNDALASVTAATNAQTAADARAVVTVEQATAARKRQADAARAQAIAEKAARDYAIQANSSGMARAAAANLSFQMNDIATMTAMGQSPWMMTMQQGPQVIQVLGQMKSAGMAAGPAIASAIGGLINPMALLTLGTIAGGAALAQWAMQAVSAGKDSRSFGEVLESLPSAIDRYQAANERARRSTTALQSDFGSAAGAASALLAQVAERERRSIERDLTALREQIPQEMGVDLSPHLQLGQLRGQEQDLLKTFGLSTWRDESWQTARSVIAAFREVDKASGLDEQIAAVQKLHDLYLQAAGAAGGFSKQEDDHLAKIQQAMQGLLTLRGADENSKTQTVVSRAIVELEREAEISGAILRHGQNSAEVEKLRADHARENLRLRLEELGVHATALDAGKARDALERRLAADRDTADQRRQKAGASMLADLTRQGEVSAAILAHGENSAEVDAVRARHAQEIQQQKLTEAGHGAVLIGQAQTLLAAEQARVAAIKAQNGARSADRMMAEMRDRSAMQVARITHGENSLQLRELEIAAEHRLFEESLRTLQVSEARKEQLRQQWELTTGLASVDPFGRLASGMARDRDHADAIARVQLKMRLVAVGATARTRALAIHEAEVRMRREGYELGSR